MKTVDCPVDWPFKSEELRALSMSLWQVKKPRRVVSDASDVLMRIDNLRFYAGELVRMERSVRGLADLTIKARDSVLEVLADFIGFLVQIGQERPDIDGAEWSLFKDDDGKIKIHVKDGCRHCDADAAETSVPESYPEFCSEQCALNWLDSKATDIARFSDLEETIRQAEEKADEKARAEVAEENKEHAQDLAHEYLNSEENTLLAVIRVHGSDSRIDLATAAWKLENLFRSGRLSL